ncbi:MAG TPA: LacI family DNA-binding transcriptional regulator [Caulobacteraceae bacterium]|nr:LacI family DNA-binding transcriptional regulator [Caulobacteraceae bacterium]
MNDVARLAEVSKKTVSRVINQSPFVSVETRERVEAVIADLGYSPDPQAQGLAFRRSFVIGFIYNNPNPQYIVNAQQGILDAARRRGFELMVRPCDLSSPTFLQDVRAFVERQKLFGVILFPRVSENEKLVALLNELGCPYVRVASVELDEPQRMIVSHDSEGAYEAARHIASLGHRRVALITGPKNFRSAHERRRGFEEGLASQGLTLDPRYVAEGEYTFESGVARAGELLRLDPRPTAICTLNDEMAAGVYRAAHELGLSIPADLSVVGFDDAPIATRLWPPLTTVLLPIREMGRLAAETLMAAGDEAAAEGPAAAGTRITPTLIVRESSTKPA